MSETTLIDRLQAALGDTFRVERELGRGGMATVYLAEDLQHGRRVAVKVVNPEVGLATTGERFRREISIAASLQHPHIVSVLSSGSGEGLQYYIMPFVEGESLRARLDREKQLPLDDALRLARAVAAALDHAHQRGLVHRDIKPENILLSGGEAMVTDFGIARLLDPAAENLTATGMIFGTPAYMSPEQSSGSRDVDARSDIYSLGCVLYEMIVGHPPFMGSTAQEIMARHALDPVPPAQSGRETVREELEVALATALAKNPVDRFPSAGAFAEELERIRRLGPGTGRSRATTLPPRVGQARRSRRRLLWAGAIAVVAVAGALIGRQMLAGADAPTRVAVLPLRNIGLPDEELFAEGLTDEITFRLARLDDLAVISRNNTISLSEGRTVQEVGRELGTDYLVVGSVRWMQDEGGRRVRIITSLVRVSDGRSFGETEFSGTAADVFEVQSAVAQRVAEALPVRLGAAERGRLQTASSNSPEAYREYTQGRTLWQRRTPQDLVEAVSHFEAALRIDSGFARAWSGLADAYVLYRQFGVTAVPPQVAWTRAREAAERAVALDSTLAEARASLGEVLFYSAWDVAGAERRFREAIELDPSYATAHQWLAELLALVGRGREAVEAAQRAVDLDPVSPVVNNALAMAFQSARRHRDAIGQSARVRELVQASRPAANDVGAQVLLGYALHGAALGHLALGEYQPAVALMAQLGDTTALTRAWMRAAADPGYRPEARRIVEGAGDALTARPALMQAFVFAALGDVERTVAALERVVREDSPIATGARIVALFDPMRGDPRFQAALRRFGYPE